MSVYKKALVRGEVTGMPGAQQEKKVEYIELIYDLIFVYIIGRNNSLLEQMENGFVPGPVFLAYILCTLAAIQIWNYSTFYINVYGQNDFRDHVFLFINMYLLYYMGNGIRVHWEHSFYKYSIAWALILANIGLQHLVELRHHRAAPWVFSQLKAKAIIILCEAALVVVHILVYTRTGISIAWVPILFGITAMLVSGWHNSVVPVDFPHLTERAMLYIVFTFGEMIIAVSPYFSEDLSPGSVYFATMTFLIVVGLFLSYGRLYNNIIDRERTTDGAGYMVLHIFLIFSLNNLSIALEFMRLESVALLPKTAFLTSSFVVYFIFLFLTGLYAKDHCRFSRHFLLVVLAIAASFAILMFLFREKMYINIAVSVLYVFGIYLLLYRQSRLPEHSIS